MASQACHHSPPHVCGGPRPALPRVRLNGRQGAMDWRIADMGRTRARHQVRPGALDRQKERRRRRRRARRLRRRRDVESVEVAGRLGHGSCGRKVRYPTRQGAETFAASVRARFGAALPEQFAYRCALCGGWHLTSHPRPEARRADSGGDCHNIE